LNEKLKVGTLSIHLSNVKLFHFILKETSLGWEDQRKYWYIARFKKKNDACQVLQGVSLGRTTPM